ncbi:MAG: DNA recombination/repair protein RecA, partial [Thermotogota bacterium]|nr:DNA recombination/repair protein RecA [Thermotogota bacterium]
AKENDIFNLAVEEDLIQRKGAWFSYINENGEEVSLGQGKTNSVSYLIENPDILDYLEYTIRKKHNLIIPDYLIEKFESNSSKSKKEKNEEVQKN